MSACKLDGTINCGYEGEVVLNRLNVGMVGREDSNLLATPQAARHD